MKAFTIKRLAWYVLLAAVGGEKKLIENLLNRIVRVTMDETLDTRQAVITLTFDNGKEFSLWTTSGVQTRERHVAIMQPTGEPLPCFPRGWPTEQTSTLNAAVRTVTPY